MAALEQDACPFVQGVKALDRPADKSLQTFAFLLQSFHAGVADVSGTLTLYAENRRYDVAFDDATAARQGATPWERRVPIVVHFSKPTWVLGAYVSRLKRPEAVSCEPTVIFASDDTPEARAAALSLDREMPANNRREFEASVALAPTHDAGEGLHTAFQCDHPFASARLLRAPELSTPEIVAEMGLSRRVYVNVLIASDGSLDDVRVLNPPVNEGKSEAISNAVMNSAALTEVKASRYAPAHFDCRPASAEYVFIVDFGMR